MNTHIVVIHLYLFGLLRWHSYVHTIYRIQWPVRATTDSDAAMLSQQVRASVITHFYEVSHETEPLSKLTKRTQNQENLGNLLTRY